MGKQTNSKNIEHPGVHIPPPVIVGAFFTVGIVCDIYLLPGIRVSSKWLKFAGVGLVALATVFVLWAAWRYYHHKTNILPHKPDQALIETGPFRFSRNPIYFSMLLGQVGLALIFGGVISILSVLPACLALRFYVIAREEKYLEHIFGQPYLDFKQKTRRWI